jgi:hypothetical protein
MAGYPASIPGYRVSLRAQASRSRRDFWRAEIKVDQTGHDWGAGVRRCRVERNENQALRSANQSSES